MVDLIRQLGDHQRGTTAGILFYLNNSAHSNGAAASFVGISGALGSDDQSGGREVRAFNPPHDRGQGLLFVGVVILQRPEHRVGQLTQVVRRDIGCHADRDAA
ncbi:Uncharacterised protein [Mycobacterium tuberculosis]|nr:Uncharacterised protein [Mycobacterium tuberculosis]CKQ96421.1 Uncharacterised protein [Mycobacterium tuberculosis]CKT46523.1 Uncharacterised protein [Mycobacterium tuberculosis]CKT79695.1 Uncharacterised protein [Mycobacterium tuberculosis]CKW61118.1 Uncharacterised protein [Mycobacterium tuberculosis]